MNGMRMRLETNPGKSRASAGVLPRSRARATIAAAVSSEVSSPRITSTSWRTGTGLKKCMPMTRSGRFVAAARLVIGMDDVFEARIAAGGNSSSARRKMPLLASGVLDDGLDQEVGGNEVVDRLDAREHLRRVNVAFLGELREAPPIAPRPRSTAPGNASCSETRRPEAATTCAIPPPICPAPTTRTCSKSTSGGYRCTERPVTASEGSSRARIRRSGRGDSPAPLARISPRCERRASTRRRAPV